MVTTNKSSSLKTRAASVSIISNSLLITMKLIVGFMSGSVSIISEAIHSGLDLVAAVIAWVCVRMSDRPADREHQYGHGKAESISGAVEAALIVFAAIWIAYEAIHKIYAIISSQARIEFAWLGVGVMLISGVVNILVSRYLFKVARLTDSMALEADAHHLSTDVMTSFGVALGLSVVAITGLDILDPIVAIAVATMIGYIGGKLTYAAGRQLMDGSLTPDEIDCITGLLDAETRLLNWHNLRTRKTGSLRHVDFHVVLPPEMSLVEAHAIAENLELQIREKLVPCEVVVHIDPWNPAKVDEEQIIVVNNSDEIS